MTQVNIAPWGANWMWGLPLIMVTVVIHSYGLVLLNRRVTIALAREGNTRLGVISPILIVGGTALIAALLHGFEAGIWALAFRQVGALADMKSGMLYSLNAITSYGHEGVNLELRWQLLGALEALNGWILFGLTTAFLFSIFQKIQVRLNNAS
jgi:hypothetical protein